MKVNQTKAMPGAWITRTSDRGRKSIKNGKVYIDDNSEFLIELYNPLTSCVLCDIKLNGQPISKTGLVLKPGQRFYLDCFPDDKKKFIFKTYEVENNQESKEAIAKNGLLEVRFYKEEVVSINNWRPRFEKVIEKHYHHYNLENLWNSQVKTTGSPSTLAVFGNIGPSLNNDYLRSAGLWKMDMGVQYNNTQYNQISSSNLSGSIETGRIEKGLSSSQQFTEIDMEFQSMCICAVILQILPESRRPIETKEIIQPKHKEIIAEIMNPKYGQVNFCESCGNKLKGSENFCPSCGKKLK